MCACPLTAPDTYWVLSNYLFRYVANTRNHVCSHYFAHLTCDKQLIAHRTTITVPVPLLAEPCFCLRIHFTTKLCAQEMSPLAGLCPGNLVDPLPRPVAQSWPMRPESKSSGSFGKGFSYSTEKLVGGGPPPPLLLGITALHRISGIAANILQHEDIATC